MLNVEELNNNEKEVFKSVLNDLQTNYIKDYDLSNFKKIVSDALLPIQIWVEYNAQIKGEKIKV